MEVSLFTPKHHLRPPPPPTTPNRHRCTSTNNPTTTKKQVGFVDYNKGEKELTLHVSGIKKSGLTKRHRLKAESDKFQKDWGVTEVVMKVMKMDKYEDVDGVLNCWVGRFERKNFPILIRQLDKIEAIRYYPYRHVPLPYQINANMKKLWSIEWDGLPGSSLPTNFLTGELCCLILSRCEQKKLWEGYKFLPNLRTINLTSMMVLITTPDLKGLPNLERIVICRCPHLEEIHPSVGCLESKLGRDSELKKQADKIATDIECGLEDPFLPHNNFIHKGLRLIHKGLTKLYISNCELGDDNIGSVIGELPNLQELGVSRNKFSRINFSLLQLPRLKWLNVSGCKNLVELLELPTNIGVLRADYRRSLESIGDISNCKYLWKVSLKDAGPIVYEILDSIHQVNAIEDHFISLALPANIQMDEFVRFVRVERFTMQLSHKYWYDDYCGFLICIVTRMFLPCFYNHTEAGDGQGFLPESCQESNEAPYTDELATTYVGYVSSNLLMRHTPWWNSAYNLISISVTGKSMLNNKSSSDDEIWLGGELVPRKSKGYGVQTTNVATDFSKFWDDEFEDRKTFTIENDSSSSIKIVWYP